MEFYTWYHSTYLAFPVEICYIIANPYKDIKRFILNIAKHRKERVICMKKGVFAAYTIAPLLHFDANISVWAALPQNLRHTVRTNLPISCYLQQYRSHQKIIRKHNFLCSLFQNGSAYWILRIMGSILKHRSICEKNIFNIIWVLKKRCSLMLMTCFFIPTMRSWNAAVICSLLNMVCRPISVLVMASVPMQEKISILHL